MAVDLTLYKDKTQSKALVVERTKLPASSDLDSMLDVSAGTLNGVTVYRPYYVCARVLGQRVMQLKAAEGATFVDPLLMILEFLKMQRAIDLAAGLIVPEGMEAVPDADGVTMGNRLTPSPSGLVELREHW